MNSRKMPIIAAIVFAISASQAFAHDAAIQNSSNVYDLKDGGALYVFKNGKMALEDKFGRVSQLKGGEVLETKDGKRITANGNEIAELDFLLLQGHQGD